MRKLNEKEIFEKEQLDFIIKNNYRKGLLQGAQLGIFVGIIIQIIVKYLW